MGESRGLKVKLKTGVIPFRCVRDAATTSFRVDKKLTCNDTRPESQQRPAGSKAPRADGQGETRETQTDTNSEH